MSHLPQIIEDEIRVRGAISFARFMELALYCPVYGFYEREGDRIGRKGDFYTSVSTGALFGQLLAWYFAELLSRPSPAETSWQILEAGAHDAQLARDILSWLQTHRRALCSRLSYILVEPSETRRNRQRNNLGPLTDRVSWEASPDSALCHYPDGLQIVFSNELLDALPVHRVGWSASERRWFEWGVAMARNRFTWTRLPALSPGLEPPSLPAELLDVLPDGFTTEIGRTANQWWSQTAGSLRRGYLVAIDYGLEAEEFFLPRRAAGTLRGYRSHRLVEDVLENPGEQDITVHVNFTQLREAGETLGLKTELDLTQAQFLTRLAESALQDAAFQPWTHELTRQFQTLTHPQHLGRAFRVLIQSRPR